MKLSEQELRWLSRWEKRERQWLPITRWICVANGIICVLAGAYLIHYVRRFLAEGISGLGFSALFHFSFLVWLACGLVLPSASGEATSSFGFY
jgi:uncharacterized ion transporter superfamily protein YfcC